ERSGDMTAGRIDRQYPTRRHVLGAGGAAFVATLVAGGCDRLSTEPAGKSTTDTGGKKGKEAPMLAERVASGDLPKVEERLPANPLVVEPAERVGTYGGTWSNPLEGPDLVGWLQRTIGYEGLVRWRTDWSGAPGTVDIIPNVAESF